MLKLLKRQAGTSLQGTSALYWSEAVAVVPMVGTHWLGSHSASTPRLALRWLHSRGHDIADQLDTRAADLIRYWLQDRKEHEQALRLLAAGHSYTFTAFEHSTRYILTARPTLGLAANNGRRRSSPGRHRAQER
ncbi:hypothetical protein GCM10018793_05680 [Streptomyces sulfonofaciens]|uniref:Uncharacterized protein n=1 Tax=Streptomyces sulfonofaciens TaxID=68272 RepID=A0A919FQV8_9ACTN|nr:hypothetical protein [Streptomyces sulfonofaciens]GHH70897.1 hypothetical protein GCM10018793_05680 [Streptomyces sulfonofaciens]